MKRKTVVILGGSSGIGKAAAQRFAKEGWQVVIASKDYEGAVEVAASLDGKGHLSMPLDIRNQEQLDALGDAINTHYSGFDALINSVGISTNVPVLDSDFTDWDSALQVMMYGTVASCRTLVPLLHDGGRIILISSIHSGRVERGSSAYGMAKAAINQYSRSLALELAPRNILSNAIAPGFVDTPMSIDKNGVNELDTDWFKDNYVKYDHLPLKRAANPEEIAGVAYFLAGPDASYITGSIITVDGGLTITF
ncbi:MAG: SDR family oxidoreductase [Pedobacter sp.]|nr:MAG: SDR family oxidoreductase [Pedobacter sp.]